MMDKVNTLMQYAVEHYGLERRYEVSFGASTPMVLVTYPDGTAVAELWMSNDEIRETVFGS